MKIVALRIAVAAVRVLALLTELFVRRDDRIVFISCQDDQPTQDILDLAEAVRNLPETPRVVVLSGRMRRSVRGAFLFFGRMLSMLKQIAAARIVVIDAYCPAVSIPRKRSGQKVVQIWHAPEAIKKFSLQILDTPDGYDSMTAMVMNMHSGYDYILCPSDATLPFFEEAFGYPESSFVKYGQPSLDRLGLMKRPAPGMAESLRRFLSRAAIHEMYPALAGEGGVRPLTIVYAPTFRNGADVDAEGLTRAFAREASVSDIPLVIVLKLHPLDAAKGSGDSLATGRRHAGAAHTARNGARFSIIADADFPLIDWYAAADAIVTDYSGVAVDAAAAGVASYYYLYDIDDYMTRRGLNVDLREEETVGMYAFVDAGALAEQVMRDFAEAAHLAYDYDALAAFAHKYIEVPLSGNTERLAAFVVEQ